MGARDLVASSVVVVAALFAVPVAAEPRHAFDLKLDVRDYFLRAMPTFSARVLATPLRTVGGELPSTGPQHMLGIAVDSQYVWRQRLVVPLFGVVGAGAVGESPNVVTSLDGSLVSMRPWTSGAVSFLLPGIGARFVARRWSFSVSVRGVVTATWMNATVANGAAAVDPGASRGDDSSGPALFAGTFGARASLDACRRLDPVQRVCIFVEPHLYEFSAMNGGSAGLRLELGP